MDSPPSRFDADGRARDLLGRIQPSRFNVITFQRAFPGFIEQFTREVPPDFFTQDAEVIEVACPCGQTPQVPVGGMTECGCERFYLATARWVRVANSPVEAATPVAT